jgi:general secretion pathway protein J
VDESLARTAAMQRAIFRLQSDLEQSRNRPIRDEFGDVQPAFRVNDEGLLEFTRGGWRNPRLIPRSSLERIAYGVKEKQLVRYSWINLDRVQGQVPLETTVLEQVRSASWRFLNQNQEWVTSWPPTAGQPDRLPLGVELLLDTEDWGEIRYLFRLVEGEPPENVP